MRQLVIAAVVVTGLAHAQGSKKLTLADLFLKPVLKLSVLSQLQWTPDGKALVFRDKKDLVRVEVPSLARQVWIDDSSLVLAGETRPITYDYYVLAPDGRSVLFADALPARSVKTGGNLYLYDLSSRRLRRIAEKKDDVSLAQFSPDGRKLGFVKRHNLVVLDIDSGNETALTADGSETVLNGELDWVYEEEFAVVNGWQWSPDSRRIAFLRSDQSRVPKYPLLNYAKPQPDVYWMRYPKAGDANSDVRVGVVDVAATGTRWVDVGFRGEHYVPRVQWAPDSRTLLVQLLNRRQNELELLAASVENGSTRRLLTERHATWVDVTDDLHFFPAGDAFTWTSDRSGYRHLYRVSLADGSLRALTSGRWEVSHVHGVDAAGTRVFYSSNRDALSEQNVYSVVTTSRTTSRLTRSAGTHQPTFSPDRRHFTDFFSSVERLPQVALADADGKELTLLAKNEGKELADYAMARHEFFDFETSEGVRLHGLMMKPANFDPAKKYAVLLAPYGGPGSQRAVNRWSSLWHHYLTQKDIVVAIVDNRGTGGRGKEFAAQVYRRLGTLESRDQIEAAKWFQSQPWVDSSKLLMWGWSYGGYLTALTAAKAGPLFRAAIAVAPVSDWKYYDSIYTERYMGLPAENPDGYKESSAITHASGVDTSLLVVHGTGDDNVHYQNALSLVDALLAENKDVQTMIYPYRTHGISEGRYTTYHLYRRLTDFFLTRLAGPPPPAASRHSARR